MINVCFIYESKEIKIPCKESDLIREILGRFEAKVNVDINKFYFLHDGDILSRDKRLDSLLNNESKKNKCIQILAIKEEDSEKIDTLRKSEDVICPNCYRPGRLLFDHLNVILFCNIGHTTGNLSLEEYEKTQKINESKIICDICKKNNKSETYNNQFYICFKCKKNICPTCKSLGHNKEHDEYVHKYQDRIFFCDEHNEIYNMYCNTCEKNICIECENEHSSHKLISYGSVLINAKELLNQQNKIKEIALCIKEKGNKLINQINKIIEDIDKYKDISIDIINNYLNNKKRNYEKLINIKDLISNNNKLFEEIKKIDDSNLQDILNLEINYEDIIKI